MSRKVILSILGILILIGGAIAGVILIRQQQELREEAAVPGGQAEVSIFPASADHNVGATFPVSIYYNTKGIAIASIKVRLMYPFSGASPEVSTTAEDIEISDALLTSTDWNCPTKKVETEGGNVIIEVSCANLSATGGATAVDNLLATINFTVNRTPVINPVVMTFDRSQSQIIQKSNGQDILGIPTGEGSEGSYNIGGVAATNTPTPTGVSQATSTPSPTGVVTSSPTPTGATATLTPTTVLTSTPTATGAAQLPDAGISYPTLLGIGLGILLIFGSLLFAL